jgi:hypothetical protein
MRRWPWITTIVAVLLAVSPPGCQIIAALDSGEALSRNIAQPIATMVAVILLAFGLLEWLMWQKINSVPNFPPSRQTTISDRHKPD